MTLRTSNPGRAATTPLPRHVPALPPHNNLPPHRTSQPSLRTSHLRSPTSHMLMQRPALQPAATLPCPHLCALLAAPAPNIAPPAPSNAPLLRLGSNSARRATIGSTLLASSGHAADLWRSLPHSGQRATRPPSVLLPAAGFCTLSVIAGLRGRAEL